MSFSTPVVLLTFNRPKLTNILFEKIALVQPQKLLVVADGPRSTEEAKKCEECRAVIEKIDWKCEILTNFSEVNLGCKKRISSGLDWVFSEVEEAIILEDDCIPTPSFFNFCQTLLEYYRHDERIMLISGDNFVENNSKFSYRFSKYNHIWGWASWRRAWKYYDVEMKSWPAYKEGNFISSVCEDPVEQRYWTDIFDRVFAGSIDTWDYQWTYACWSQNGLSILPNLNLVSNIGFGINATHIINPVLENLPVNDIWDINHPLFVSRNKAMDDSAFDLLFNGRISKIKRRLLLMIKYFILKVRGRTK